MTPSVPVLTGFDCIFLTCFQYGIILCPKIFAGVEFPFLCFLWSHGKPKKEKRALLKISDLLCREQMTASSLIRLLHPSRILKLVFAVIMTYLRISPPPPFHTKLLRLFFLHSNEQGIGGVWVGTGRCLTARQRRDLGEFRLTMSRDFCRKNYPLYQSASSLVWAEPWLFLFCFFL